MIHEIHKYDNKWPSSPTSAVLIIESRDTRSDNHACYRIYECFCDGSARVVVKVSSANRRDTVRVVLATNTFGRGL
jgi:hypothetical protein